MKTNTILARVGGVLMLGVFAINLYIALYDINLSQLSPLHSELNWIIAIVDLVAAVFLLVKPASVLWKSFAGIVWPIVYLGSLVLDVETRLCLGTSVSTCSPTVSDAYNYLILGSSAEDWVLWPYTVRLAIGLVVIVMILSVMSLALHVRESR